MTSGRLKDLLSRVRQVGATSCDAACQQGELPPVAPPMERRTTVAPHATRLFSEDLNDINGIAAGDPNLSHVAGVRGHDTRHDSHTPLKELLSRTRQSRATPSRRRKVLAMLARDGVRYAVLVDNPNTNPVVMALATTNATGELLIPQNQYDAFRVLEMVRGWEA